MFNPLTPAELVAGLARVLHAAGRAGGAGDAYARSQLLSASSVARYLSAEQRGAPELLAWARIELGEALEGPAFAEARAAIASAADGPELGAALVRLLDALREDHEELRRRIHALLAELTEREVAMLMSAEPPAQSG